MLRTSIAAVVVAVLTLMMSSGFAAARNACIACQNKCWSEARTCRKHHGEIACMADYGSCKVACKGSLACTESCTPVKGHAKTNQEWHGAKCYSSQGCHCEAFKCAKAPHYRDAKCVSPPG